MCVTVNHNCNVIYYKKIEWEWYNTQRARISYACFQVTPQIVYVLFTLRAFSAKSINSDVIQTVIIIMIYFKANVYSQDIEEITEFFGKYFLNKL